MSRGAAILSGVLVLLIGALVSYVLAYGAIVVGIFRVLRGVLMRSDPRAAASSEDTEQPWSLGEALGKALSAIRASGGMLALPMLLPLALALGAGAAAASAARVNYEPPPLGMKGPPPTWIPMAQMGLAAAAVAGFVAWVLVMPALARGALAAVRGEPAKLRPFVRYVPRLFVYALLQLFFVAITLPALGVPALPLALTPLFVVDQDLPLFEAMRRSWEVGARHLGKLFMLHVAIAPLFLVGQVTGVGTLVTVPFYFAALAYAYVRVTARSELPWYPPEFASRSIRSFLQISSCGCGACRPCAARRGRSRTPPSAPGRS
jgi:hypothetical protein